MKFRDFIDEQRNHETNIASLRAKTVKNGATEAEARSASAKADELEKKYAIKQQAIQNRRIHKKSHRNNWSKAQMDAHLDAMERDRRRR